jgi:hypothetical protein
MCVRACDMATVVSEIPLYFGILVFGTGIYQYQVSRGEYQEVPWYLPNIDQWSAGMSLVVTELGWYRTLACMPSCQQQTSSPSTVNC